jgi:hypothetical protein
VSTKFKHRRQEFTLATVIRLGIFSVIIFFLIKYFASSSNQDVLGDQTINLSPYAQQVTNLLPEKSRQTLQNLPQSPIFGFIQEKFTYLQQESGGFPQKQIKDIKKAVVKEIYDKILNSIENQ